MTDRELLEKAANAAGYQVMAISSDGTEAWVTKKGGTYEMGKKWNPLESNADAFRLMVDAELVVAVAHGEILATHDEITAISGPLGDAPYATARRSIVRAAANKGDAQ